MCDRCICIVRILISIDCIAQCPFVVSDDVLFAQRTVIELDIAQRSGKWIVVAATAAISVTKPHIICIFKQIRTEISAQCPLFDLLPIQIEAVVVAAIHSKCQLVRGREIHLIQRDRTTVDLLRTGCISGFYAQCFSIEIYCDVVIFHRTVSHEKQRLYTGSGRCKRQVYGKILLVVEQADIIAGIDCICATIDSNCSILCICSCWCHSSNRLRCNRPHRCRHDRRQPEHGSQQHRIYICFLHLIFLSISS